MTFFNTLILLGSLQGLISFILLWKVDKNRQSNRLMATLILLISLACLNIFLLEQDLKVESVFIRFLVIILPLTVIMPIGPLLYFYIRSLTESSFELKRKDQIHFYPVLLDLIPYLTYLICYLMFFANSISDQQLIAVNQFVEAYDKYVDIPRWISISVYLWLVIKLIRNHPANESVRWGRQLTLIFLVFQVMWFLFLIFYLIPSTTDWLIAEMGWYPLYIPLTIMVYWFGIKGFLINARVRASRAKPIAAKEVDSNLKVLKESMEQAKLYLNPELTLNDVVQHTNLSQKTISAVLNQHMGKSFNEFVNRFRVEAVKHKIRENQDQNLTLTGIAYSCGFNSQATFQRVFKAMTMQTPGQYAKSVSQNA